MNTMQRKNKLRNLRAYIAGPIEYIDTSQDHKQNSFKDMIRIFLESKGVQVLDPKRIGFQGISEISNRQALFAEKDYTEVRRQMKLIVRKDLRCVDISDFIIVYLPKDVRTTGSIHEIVEADRQKKPVLLLCPEGIEHIPAWLWGIIPLNYMFDSIQYLQDYLNMIDHDDNISDDKTDDRWQFIVSGLVEDKTKF